MGKRRMIIILVSIVVTALVITLLLFRGHKVDEWDAKEVKEIPAGFIPMPSPSKGDKWEYMGWETQITFIGTDGKGMYSTGFSNDDFIVKCQDVYYVSEAKHLELVEIAALAQEERNRAYNLGDVIEVRGAGETVYPVQVISFQAVTTEPNYYYDGDALITYHIKFAVPADFTEEDIKRIFGSVTSKNGVRLGVPDFIDRETGSVQLRKKGDDRIPAIVLCSPEYPGLEYRVVVDE